MNSKLKKALAGVGVLGAFGLGGAALAGAQGDQPAPAKSAGSADETVTGAEAQRAGQAALKSAGGGQVVSVDRETPDQGADTPEPGDTPDSAQEQARERNTAYSVEVRKADGSTVDVSVDDAYAVVGTEREDAQDDEGGSEEAGGEEGGSEQAGGDEGGSEQR